MVFGWIILFSYLFGLFCKIIIYEQMNKSNSIIGERPINVLIIVDEAIYLSLLTFMTFNLVILLVGNQTPFQFFFAYIGVEINELVSKFIMSGGPLKISPWRYNDGIHTLWRLFQRSQVRENI